GPDVRGVPRAAPGDGLDRSVATAVVAAEGRAQPGAGPVAPSRDRGAIRRRKESSRSAARAAGLFTRGMDPRRCRPDARSPPVRDAAVRVRHDEGGDRRRNRPHRDAGQGSLAIRLVAAAKGAWSSRSMSQPRDDWDADERDALDGLEGELAE